jgi:hypothetical protein
MDLDPESLRLPGALSAMVPASPRRRSRPQHYLGGKPPMAWLSRAHTAGKAALATGTALWFKRGLQGGKNAPIRVDSSLRRSMGLTHDQARRGVHALEAAGLVQVHRGGRGRCAEVTIVQKVAEPSVASADPSAVPRETDVPPLGGQAARTMATGPRSDGTGGKESEA